MLSKASFVAFASVAAAGATLGSISERAVASKGGWSLSMGKGECPTGTSTCFSDKTGNALTSNRLENCCPSGTTPSLYCGTYVNTGQPYACCPLDNPDCRGDVGKTTESSVCANSGWAQWYIPDGGYNSFCCLPGQYGYWYPALGQDAVGQCSDSNELPDDALPGTQVNNGDGSVDKEGVQVIALEAANTTCNGYGICKLTSEPAPTCDVIHYGWSLQTNESSCTAGSSLCGYSSGKGSCCPTGLSCGTVLGDSEVPVCCPADNPDCRGAVEGLWPQVCADSSWSLWHVNENGNHFCCKPGQIGYNRIHDVYATGLCGSAVPTNTNTTIWMRSILDYVGDGSVAGSSLKFPCDTSPAPNASYPAMCNDILNPPVTLNPFKVTIQKEVIYAPNVTVSFFPTATPKVIGNPPFAPLALKQAKLAAAVGPHTETIAVVVTIGGKPTTTYITSTIDQAGYYAAGTGGAAVSAGYTSAVAGIGGAVAAPTTRAAATTAAGPTASSIYAGSANTNKGGFTVAAVAAVVAGAMLL